MKPHRLKPALLVREFLAQERAHMFRKPRKLEQIFDLAAWQAEHELGHAFRRHPGMAQ